MGPREEVVTHGMRPMAGRRPLDLTRNMLDEEVIPPALPGQPERVVDPAGLGREVHPWPDPGSEGGFVVRHGWGSNRLAAHDDTLQPDDWSGALALPSVGHLGCQGVHRPRTHLVVRQGDCRQRRKEALRDRVLVVEPDNRHVFGHPQAALV